MKKVIERMDGNVRETQRRARAAAGEASGEGLAAQKEKEEKKGRRGRWLGLGKKEDKEGAGVGGAGGKERSSDDPGAADADDDGLCVEQYLLVVLEFSSTITRTIEVDSTASIWSLRLSSPLQLASTDSALAADSSHGPPL
ncbi:hypothetical protein JCM8208_004213 [Rhodotorula glutinis]